MNRKLVTLFFLALVFRIVISPFFWHPDVTNHVDWGIRFFEYGIGKIYSPESNVWSFTWPNQPPGTMLIFAFIRKVYELMFGVLWQLNVSISAFPSAVIVYAESHLYQVLLKLPAIISDLGIAYLLYLFVRKIDKKQAVWAPVVFLFNPVVWYNSAVWGQTDALINFVFLLSFWMLVQKRLFISISLVFLCLFIKISLAIFIPVYFIFLIRQKFKLPKVLLSIFIASLLVIVLTIPFSGSQNPVPWLYEIYKTKVLTNQLQVITANAFNVWMSLTGIAEKPHTLFLGPLTYQHWGYIIFSAAYLPVIYKLLKKPNATYAVWAFFMMAFTSWLFLTNMHERYLYPAFPFLVILMFKERKLIPVYVLLSITSMLNLYNLWWTPNILLVKNFLSNSNFIVARIIGIVNLVLYLVSYKLLLKTPQGNIIKQ